MVRKQLYIDDDLNRGLKTLAIRTRLSEAEHVRAALRAYLDTQTPTDTGLDALADIIGLIDDPALPRDMAENHDVYLYGDRRP